MSVENPGDAEVDVDMSTLKASLACPLCDDMYRFPVTVVRARFRFRLDLCSRARFFSSRLDASPFTDAVLTDARIASVSPLRPTPRAV